MPEFRVETLQPYSAIVERGLLSRACEYLPPRRGKIFVISTADVWRHQGAALERGLAGASHERLDLPGGEANKRLASLEALAEEMVIRGADRSSLILAFGGGIVNDMAGFLAAIFMRGIPVLQIPTTLLAQVDAAVGGKTGVNLAGGKNLLGAFHQPLAVLIDPATLDTLPDREYRAGLYEVIKCGVIRDAALFQYLAAEREAVLHHAPEAVDRIIADSVRAKADVVTADERESDLRRILNFGHTFGHALEAETAYTRFLHGEAVAFGMRAAVYLAQMTGYLSAEDSVDILQTIEDYGPIPPLAGISAGNLLTRLAHDKKTVMGNIHFVLPVRIGEVAIVSSVEERLVREAIKAALG
jgi:3-dehydroquinate synthase